MLKSDDYNEGYSDGTLDCAEGFPYKEVQTLLSLVLAFVPEETKKWNQTAIDNVSAFIESRKIDGELD